MVDGECERQLVNSFKFYGALTSGMVHTLSLTNSSTLRLERFVSGKLLKAKRIVIIEDSDEFHIDKKKLQFLQNLDVLVDKGFNVETILQHNLEREIACSLGKSEHQLFKEFKVKNQKAFKDMILKDKRIVLYRKLEPLIETDFWKSRYLEVHARELPCLDEIEFVKIR